MWDPDELDEMYREQQQRKAAQEAVEKQRTQKSTCESRYKDRKLEWRYKEPYVSFPDEKHDALWILHNAVAHPLLGILPCKATVALHDKTSSWLARKENPKSAMPVIPLRRTWLLHNVVAHMAIAFFPCRETFDFHDKTATMQNVRGWV